LWWRSWIGINRAFPPLHGDTGHGVHGYRGRGRRNGSRWRAGDGRGQRWRLLICGPRDLPWWWGRSRCGHYSGRRYHRIRDCDGRSSRRRCSGRK
jgi:hypothetical protein